MDHEYLTAIETADLIRQPLDTLYAMNVQGTAPPRYKVGRRVLYRRREVQAWIESRRVESAPKAS
jgi:predicted DNA-binding transcriptional regulator AlpA